MRLGEKPWGPLLGELGSRGFSGRVEITADKPFVLVFQRGAVVDAASPLSSDSALRAALTGHFVSPSVVPAISRRIAAAPQRDDVEVVIEAARLPAEHARRLRTRVVLARAARTFAVDAGDYAVVEAPPPPGAPVCAVDVRAVVYHGARMHLSELRLAAELRQMGGVFAMKPDAPLAAYALSAAEQPIVEALRVGTTVAELEARHRDLDPRAIQVVLYTLVSCGAARGSGSAPAPVVSRAVTPTIAPRTVSTTIPVAPAVARTPTPSTRPAPPLSTRAPTMTSQPPPNVPRTVTPRASIADVTTLVATRNQLIDHGADFFSLLGLAPDASPEAVRVAHLRLATLLQPAHLALVGYQDTGAAKRLLEQIDAAFHVLTDPARRAAYRATLSRTTDDLLRAARARTIEELAARTPAAEAFHRGQLAMRGELAAKAAVEFQTACELDADNLDYQVMYAFAKFCAASDRDAIAADTRKTLERLAHKGDHPELARYHLGRVERMLGRDREALRQFREVLEVAPHHQEAASEVRVLEARLDGRSRSGGR